MATAKTTKKEESVEILEVKRGEIAFCILGTTPLIHNRMSQKVWRELLAPKGRKTAAEKASQMKHDPITEYQDSPYRIDDPKAPTAIGLLASMFKESMKSAALDLPGAKKAVIGRLVYVEGETIPVWGIPQLFMSVTRSADINRTPDVRTRAICPEWATVVRMKYVQPILRDQAIINLMAAAGLQSGVGDWRQQKGSGNYGCFEIVSENDPRFQAIIKKQGRVAQQKALDKPVAYDAQSEEMLKWFEVEKKRRGFKEVSKAA